MTTERGAIRRAVVVIGGGIMGAATAYQLARSGTHGVTLLEAGELASGSSGKPLGGVRAQFSDPTNIALGQRSLGAFERFAEELGADIGLQQVGYLFAIRDPADVAAFEASIALQNAMGVPSRMVTPTEAARLSPVLDPSHLVAAAWCAEAGFARPVAVVRGYADAAAAQGVEIRTHAPVVDLTTADGQALVTTADGTRYLTPTVVLTAGAWSSALAARVDIDLSITPVRRQIAFTAPVPPSVRLPFTIDYTTTAYFHGSEDGGLLLGWADPDQAAGFDCSVSTDWHAPLRTALSSFAPELAEAEIRSGWAGLYEMTPDCNALIGEAHPGFRLLYAAGFSGHGFLQGPAVGECLAATYRGDAPPVDITPFVATRFAGPAVRTELGII